LGDDKHQKIYEFITNNIGLDANKVAGIYQSRETNRNNVQKPQADLPPNVLSQGQSKCNRNINLGKPDFSTHHTCYSK